MKDISAHYKQANRDYKDAFQNKYEEGIRSAVEDICTKYGLDENSKLAHVVKNAMSKFLVALDSRADAYNEWYAEHSDYLTNFNERTEKVIRSNTSLMLKRPYYQAVQTASFIPLMRIDMGRSQVYLNTIMLIERHLGDITDSKMKRKSNPSEALSGSIIRRTLDLYHQANSNGLVASFSNKPQQTVNVLRKELRIK